MIRVQLTERDTAANMYFWSWQENGNDKVVGAVLMYLSKAFDCIPHELLIAKLAAYNFDKGTLEFMLSYLKVENKL